MTTPTLTLQTMTSPRRLWLSLGSIVLALLVAACATQGQYSSGRLARVTPADFISLKPEVVAVGLDIDSRIPASLNRSPDLLVGVLPVEHNAWEPIGARLKTRQIKLGGEAPDPAAGKSLRSWMDAPGGRIRLGYVLTEESKAEMARLQQKFDELLKKYPPNSGKRGSLRIRVDSLSMINPDSQSANLRLSNYLQLSVAEGLFSIWKGTPATMR
ncbi:MAG: hypothetical protein AB8C46_03310 [Burkholderiaceae bacterium]